VAAESLVESIRTAGGQAVAIEANVGKEEDVQRLFVESHSIFGSVDVLVNNAGVYSFSPLSELTDSELRRQFDINVFGLLFACREVIKHFPQDGGNIVNIGTRLPVPNSVIYTATKEAVDSITRVLANELGPRNVRVNSVNSGLVLTDGVLAAGIVPGSDFVNDIKSRTPISRIGRPEDIGELVSCLVSDEASWVTGEHIVVSFRFVSGVARALDYFGSRSSPCTHFKKAHRFYTTASFVGIYT
jgi:3-oxoacyl-[acyl-carrier protein] reductase